MSNFAWVTLTTNDTYSLGALVLAHSLKRANTKHQLAVLVTPGVSESMRDKLKDVYNVVQEVNIMDSQDSANLALLARPELGITFTKLHCWRLVQYEKCVFLDADTLVLQNCDELFEREELSAAPDVSWPDCFNSGVFVYKPSQETFDKIVEFALQHGSFDGGDQGLLNEYFSDWATSDVKKRLPFLYNVTAYATYCYLPAFKQFRDKIKILHFAGKMKPWLIHYNSQCKTPSVPSDYAHAADLIQLWWTIFFDDVHKTLNDSMRYSLPNLWEWKSNYDNKWQSEQSSQATNEQIMQYNLQYEQYQEQYTNKQIEFHDPWEDYYNKQENGENAEIQNNNATQINDNWQEENKEDKQQNEQQNEQRNEQNEHQQPSPHYQVEETHHTMQTEEQQFNNDFNTQRQQQQQQQEENRNVNETKAVVLNTSTKQYSDVKKNDKIEEKSKAKQTLKETKTTTVTTTTTKRNEIVVKNPNLDSFKVSASVSVSSPLRTVGGRYRFRNDINANTDTSRRSSSKIKSVIKQVDNTARRQEVVAVSKLKKEAGLAGALSHLRLGEPRSNDQDVYEQMMRRQSWESGHADYTGRDAFDNIWKKITETLESKPDDTGSS